MSARALGLAALCLALAGCGRQAPSGPAATSPAQAVAFFAQNGKQAGVRTLADGLQIKVVASGLPGGPHPQKFDTVKVEYVGTLIDGTVFDSTEAKGAPAVMELDGLVPAWMEAIPMMRPGDDWYIYAPAKLGYGDRGAGPIPPGSPLVFRIKLIGVLKSDRNTGLA